MLSRSPASVKLRGKGAAATRGYLLAGAREYAHYERLHVVFGCQPRSPNRQLACGPPAPAPGLARAQSGMSGFADEMPTESFETEEVDVSGAIHSVDNAH